MPLQFLSFPTPAPELHAGYDFLTVLGAHEGEGLALAGEHGGLMGLAGSRSPWLASKGQAVDVRIVEVALFYMAEVTRCGRPPTCLTTCLTTCQTTCLPDERCGTH